MRPRRPNRNNTEPRANITDPDVRVMRNQKGYVAGYNGQLVVTAQQVIVGAVLSQHPGRPHLVADLVEPELLLPQDTSPAPITAAAASRVRRMSQSSRPEGARSAPVRFGGPVVLTAARGSRTMTVVPAPSVDSSSTSPP
jgi:hypothetical protein